MSLLILISIFVDAYTFREIFKMAAKNRNDNGK